jgi:hypothetical protein
MLNYDYFVSFLFVSGMVWMERTRFLGPNSSLQYVYATETYLYLENLTIIIYNLVCCYFIIDSFVLLHQFVISLLKSEDNPNNTYDHCNM